MPSDQKLDKLDYLLSKINSSSAVANHILGDETVNYD